MSSFRRWRDRLRAKTSKVQNEPNETDTHNEVAPELAATPPSATESQSQEPPRQGLWQTAYDQIGQKERNVLSKRCDTSSMIDDVIQITKQRYQEYQEDTSGKAHKSGHNIDIRAICRKIINAALSFKDVISAVAAFDPTSHAKSAWAVISLGLTMAQNRFDLRDTLFESCEYLADALARCSYVEKNFWRSSSDWNKNIGNAIIKIYKVILQYAAEALAAQDQGMGKWILDGVTAVTSQRLTGLKASIKENEQYLNQWVQLDQHLEHEKTAEKILAGIDTISAGLQAFSQKFNLPIAEGALYDSYANQHEEMCLPDTRTELRKQISEWAESPNSRCIFWLNGMAGTGKSTIARTLAQSFKEKGQLGATFFFKKGESDRDNAKRLVSTVTRQLILFHRQLAPGVMAAIDNDSDIATKSLREQFDALLLQPLLSLETDQLESTVIIIDALDECDREDDVRLLLRLLPQLQKATSLQLRFLLTSRPNLPIELGFKSVADDHQDLILHEIPRPVVEHDITLYLEDQFTKIREERSLPLDWPGGDVMRDLVERSVPLFIAAATLCRFVHDKNWSPVKRLSALLADQTIYISKMSFTYLPILNQLLAGQDEFESQELVDEFRKIVGVIILLATPLSINALSQLLELEAPDVSNRLNTLHSVLHVSTNLDMPVGLLHLSFRDFLVDTKLKGKSPFWIDEKEQHGRIAIYCLQAMRKSLKKNICQLSGEGTVLEEIDQQIIDKSIPQELRYSCRYWTHHLIESQDPNAESKNVLDFLKKHYLHWVEVLSILGIVSEAIKAISRLQTAFQDNHNPELASFLYDAQRFILQNRQISDIAPLQIYASGLIFAPLNSVVRKQNSHQIPCWIQRFPKVDNQWNAEQQIIESHDHGVSCVAFSPDGRLLASASKNGIIKIWETATGDLQQTIKGHEKSIRAIKFSPDGRMLASGVDSEEIKIWETATGTLQRTLGERPPTVILIVFPSGGPVLSLMPRRTVKLWITATWSLQHALEEHDKTLKSVSFSTDGQLLASSTYDDTIAAATDVLQQTLGRDSQGAALVALFFDRRFLVSSSGNQMSQFWGGMPEALQQTLKSYPRDVYSAYFSPDGQLLASCSGDETIKVWKVATGALHYTLDYHSGEVASVSFSPDGRFLASGFYDGTIKLWEVASGALHQTFEGHSLSVLSVAFSPDGKVLASSSYDETLRLWDISTSTFKLQEAQEKHAGIVSVVRSPDGQLVVSTSLFDKTLKVWDTVTGELQQTLYGHEGGVNSADFSPDGRLLASASLDRRVKIWDIASGALQRTLEGHDQEVQSVVFSPDGRLIASGSEDQTIKLWETATGNIQHSLEGHEQAVDLVTFSPDARLLASSSRQSYEIRLWDTATGVQQQKITTDYFVGYLRFSSNGPFLETAVGRFEIPASYNYINSVILLEPIPTIEILGNQWVALSGKRVLWLPPNYRPCHVYKKSPAVSVSTDGMMILGHDSGRVTFFQFRC